MKVVCTGISGIDKLIYAEQVKTKLELEGHVIQIFDVWTYIQNVAKDLNQTVTKEKILDHHNVDELRALAFERICNELEKTTDDESHHSIILTHACFRWNKFLKGGFDVHYLLRINPTFYINVVDEVMALHHQLENDPQWKGRLTPPIITTWRDEETFITEILAQFQKKKVYLVAKEELTRTLSDLLFRPNLKKIYLSYPITAILKKDPNLLEQARIFAEDLRKKYIVFNPLAIKDLLGDEKDETDILAQLRHNTVWRDFKLINQSDMVVVYYPVEENSPGVNQEMFYGYTHNKDVYLFYPYRLSPFWDPSITVTKRFETFEDLSAFLIN